MSRPFAARPVAAVLSMLLALLSGCRGAAICENPGGFPESSPTKDATPVYVSDSDFYSPGAREFRALDLAQCERDAPVPLRIHAPVAPGNYAVVVFQHGFMARNDYYDDILGHVASHGFVVVAPQMYEPGLAPLLGNPTAAEEAELAARLLDWLPAHLSMAAGVTARCDRLGLAGHSRGGKVAWLVAQANPFRLSGIAGVDPGDGTGGPRGDQPRAIQGPLSFSFPSFVLGSGLGGECAPTGDNHVQFYAASPAPAWHIVALDYGHGDMLDEPQATTAAALCNSNPDRAAMRQLTGGALAAFFSEALQGGYGAAALSTASRITRVEFERR